MTEQRVVSDRQAQWLRGVLDLAVLATLATDGRSYGYAVMQSLDAAGIHGLKGGTVYPVLGRLEADGLVTSAWAAGEKGPGRKWFTITPAGLDALATGATGWAEFAEGVSAVLSGTRRRRSVRRQRPAAQPA
ncbi:PadR family transcriptional regulator [Oryzihumus leptocrescens]|uniref:PadR family transcriptional regulator n=1 Tax=Oryzihumus leptocrescens TaxID=297536 RepID=UPI001C8AFB6B|nr:PadR family transcriptional regulator [Oryzihumus leptocrescens]